MKHFDEQMPLYAAGQLDAAERAALEKHLQGCPRCRTEMEFWQALSAEIRSSSAAAAPPAGLAQKALQRVRTAQPASTLKTAFLGALSLLRAQAYLIKGEMWPTSAGIMALGVIIALFSRHAEAVTVIAPMVAAASLAALYGPENDPAYELALSAPLSGWKILLARLSVVSAYNLLLASAASLAMLLILPPGVLGAILLGWFAPMAFLSSLALFLSLWIGTTNAVALAYGLWIVQYLKITPLLSAWGASPGWGSFLDAYRQFWQSPGLLLALSLALLGMALLSTRFAGRSLPQRLG